MFFILNKCIIKTYNPEKNLKIVIVNDEDKGNG